MTFFLFKVITKNKTIKMLNQEILPKNKSLLDNKNGQLLHNIGGYIDKINNKYINSTRIKAQFYNLRNMLQNNTLNTNNEEEEELTDFEKHIKLIIIIGIIILCLSVLISCIFLILYIRKKCLKKKEEEKEQEQDNNNKDISNSKKSRKDYEMSNIFSSGLRSSTPIKRNKTFSLNPLLSSIKLRSSNKIKLNLKFDDKIISNINNSNEEKNGNEEPPKIKNEYSDFTFRTNSETDTKDNDIEEVLRKL